MWKRKLIGLGWVRPEGVQYSAAGFTSASWAGSPGRCGRGRHTSAHTPLRTHVRSREPRRGSTVSPGEGAHLGIWNT